MSDTADISLRSAVLPADFDSIFGTINDAAIAYKGVIADESWNDPYMSREELNGEINDAGVQFFVAEVGHSIDKEIVSVMGIQPRNIGDRAKENCRGYTNLEDVTLIRHAYTKTAYQRKGLGKMLLLELLGKRTQPALIGTWASTTWAIEFYQRNGFKLVEDEGKKIDLLLTYWFTKELGDLNDGSSEKRTTQMASSVVLADARWWELQEGGV
jgi:ribosomal protein S18 acetylase RimI-like enzyme